MENETSMENTKPLTPFQRKHIAKVFPEARDEMASYLREGAKVFIERQNESRHIPPFAICVLENAEFWIGCCDTVTDARKLAEELGLTLVDCKSEPASILTS